MTCVEWLRDYMAGKGKVETSICSLSASGMGFKKSELKAARVYLGVHTTSEIEDGKRVWYWELPGEQMA